MKIEGDPVARLKLFRTNERGAASGDPVYQTNHDEQMKAQPRRADWRYRLMVDGKLLSVSETGVWLG